MMAESRWQWQWDLAGNNNTLDTEVLPMDRTRTTVFGKSNPRKQSRGVISAGSNEDRILILAGNPVEIWCARRCMQSTGSNTT